MQFGLFRFWMFLFLILVSILTWTSIATAEPFLIVERSTNRNQILYEANLESPEAIRPYWHMIEKGGSTEELTTFEKTRLYGIRILDQATNGVTFSFQAIPSLLFRLEKGNDGLQAKVLGLGLDLPLKKIFLKLRGGLFPKVASILLDLEESPSRMKQVELISSDGKSWAKVWEN